MAILELFERAPQPEPVGAGLLLQPTGLAVLAELGLFGAAFACGEPVLSLQGETVTTRRVIDMDYARLGVGCCLGIQRGALFDRPGCERGAARRRGAHPGDR